MNFDQLTKKIKSDTWWSEESPCNYQQAIPAWRAFIMQNKIWGPKFLTTVIALYKNDFLFEKTSRSEKLTQFHHALDIYTRKHKFIQNEYRKFLASQKNVIQKGEKLVATFKADNISLAKAYRIFYDEYILCFTLSVMPESADVFSDQELEGNEEENVVLSTYPMLSFMEQERVDFLTMILSRKINFRKFAFKYHWIQNNYLGAKFLDEKYFRRAYIELTRQKSKPEILKELRSLKTKVSRLKTKQTQLLKQLTLSSREKKAFELLRLVSRWIDERKWAALHGIYYIDIFLLELSRRTKISKDLLGYYTPEEIVELLEKDRSVPLSELEARRKMSAYVYVNDAGKYQELIYTDEQAEKLFGLFRQTTTKSFSGHVASAPVESFAGIVQVVLNPHKEKFTSGKILVTTMTRPDFVPLMRQASAIITDEGGITSHAAIVSRELGIPCIIGTKIATKALKTGDKVEIDLVKGMVKKL